MGTLAPEMKDCNNSPQPSAIRKRTQSRALPHSQRQKSLLIHCFASSRQQKSCA